MGEAKRRRESGEERTGTIVVEANGKECFEWAGTRSEASALMRRFLKAMEIGYDAHGYAKRAAGYLLVYGMPAPGDPDHRPSSPNETWTAGEVELYRMAVLWVALREHIPDTGSRIEDCFVGNKLLVAFEGDPDKVLESTRRDVLGIPQPPGNDFIMKVGVIDDGGEDIPHPPSRISLTAGEPPKIEFVEMPMGDLWRTLGKPEMDDGKGETVRVPRVPTTREEADAMMRRGFVNVLDVTVDPPTMVWHVGWTQRELLGGRPGVLVD